MSGLQIQSSLRVHSAGRVCLRGLFAPRLSLWNCSLLLIFCLVGFRGCYLERDKQSLSSLRRMFLWQMVSARPTQLLLPDPRLRVDKQDEMSS